MVLVLKVSKKNGERARRTLIHKGYFDGEHKPDSNKNYIYFPVTHEFKTKPLLIKMCLHYSWV